jgi:hypothetical protein
MIRELAVGRVETHAANELRQLGGDVRLFRGFLDQYARGANVLAGLALALDDSDLEAAQRRRACAGKPREACSHDDQIELPHAATSASTASYMRIRPRDQTVRPLS